MHTINYANCFSPSMRHHPLPSSCPLNIMRDVEQSLSAVFYHVLTLFALFFQSACTLYSATAYSHASRLHFLFVLLIALVFYTYTQTSRAKHRTISEDVEHARCEQCGRPKPPRTHHCSFCECCIPAYDHHCVSIYICVFVSIR